MPLMIVIVAASGSTRRYDMWHLSSRSLYFTLWVTSFSSYIISWVEHTSSERWSMLSCITITSILLFRVNIVRNIFSCSVALLTHSCCITASLVSRNSTKHFQFLLVYMCMILRASSTNNIYVDTFYNLLYIHHITFIFCNQNALTCKMCGLKIRTYWR